MSLVETGIRGAGVALPVGERNCETLLPGAAIAAASDGDEDNKKRREPSEAGDAKAGGHSGGRKRRSRGRQREGAQVGAGAGAGARERGGMEDVVEKGSLFELRDALRARENELLRLKRDVAVVATTSGGFRRLAASVNCSDKGRGDETASSFGGSDGRRTSSSSSSYSSANRRASRTGTMNGESVIGLDEKSVLNEAARNTRRATGVHRPSAVPAVGPARHAYNPQNQQDSRLSGEPRDAASQQLLLMPPGSPPPLVQPLPLVGGPPAAGSPLVASAYEGLRQMRTVLLEREREAGRAKDDAEKMVGSVGEIVFLPRSVLQRFHGTLCSVRFWTTPNPLRS